MVLNRVQHLTRNRVVLDSYTQAVARVHYDFNPRSETVRTWERGDLEGMVWSLACSLLMHPIQA